VTLMDNTASESTAFAWNTTYVDGEAHLALTGEFDMASSFDVEGVIADVLSRSCTRLIVDLSGVRFIDSSGISELVKLHAALQAGGTTLSTLAPNPTTYRIFELCGLVDQLQVTASDQS
jgi:anti-sigma B factor antagonist